MKSMTHWLALAGLATLCLGVGNLTAQEPGGPGGPGGERGNRGNFDPAQFQQRMMQGMRDRLQITDDTEWKAIEPLVQKVMDLRREQLGATMRGFGRGGRGGGPGGNTDANSEQTALSDAIEKNASKDELKTKMAAFRKAKAEKEAALKSAQDELKKFLTTKQEAIALQMGLVN